MTLYAVQNNDNMLISICLTKGAARKVCRIGRTRWHEAWRITPFVADQIDVDMLTGCESYRSMLTREARRRENPTKPLRFAKV